MLPIEAQVKQLQEALNNVREVRDKAVRVYEELSTVIGIELSHTERLAKVEAWKDRDKKILMLERRLEVVREDRARAWRMYHELHDVISPDLSHTELIIKVNDLKKVATGLRRPEGRPCTFRPSSGKGELLEGTWSHWGVSHTEYCSELNGGPGHYPSAVIEDDAGRVWVVPAENVCFTDREEPRDDTLGRLKAEFDQDVDKITLFLNDIHPEPELDV